MRDNNSKSFTGSTGYKIGKVKTGSSSEPYKVGKVKGSGSSDGFKNGKSKNSGSSENYRSAGAKKSGRSVDDHRTEAKKSSEGSGAFDKFKRSTRTTKTQERFERSERSQRPARPERGEFSERTSRFNKEEHSERPTRFNREDRNERSTRFNRENRSERPARFNREDRNRDTRADKRPEEKKTVKRPAKGACPVSHRCGGCIYQGAPYAEQLKKKQEMVNELFADFVKPEAIIGMRDPLNYRNKVHHVFSYNKGNIIAGTYEANSHIVIPVENCMIEDKKCQEIIQTIKKLCKSFKIKIYDEDTDYGLLRHVLVRRGFTSGELMVVLVLRSPILPGKNNFARALKEAHPEITSIVINVNDRDTSMVLGKRDIPLYGKAYIQDELLGLTYRISPQSFYQVNPTQTEVLYRTALDFSGLSGREIVVDAYCGIGTIALTAAGRASKVIGIELNPDAVKDARQNARDNDIANVDFYQGDAGEFMEDMASRDEHIDVVFMDPPRSGSTETFMKSAIKLNPNRIVYVSCGPETLARDLRFFEKHGYQVKKIQPVDMFPYTGHVETVCLLVLRNPVTHINIDVDVEELVQDKRGQATYEQIKEYVLEQTGLKVSSLYISQIKRKCGLDVGDSYNKPKSENAKVPQCPPEKEKAIMDALRHFGMI